MVKSPTKKGEQVVARNLTQHSAPCLENLFVKRSIYSLQIERQVKVNLTRILPRKITESKNSFRIQAITGGIGEG
jgi:hypothetical protein